MECFGCKHDVVDADIRWRNLLRAGSKDADGVLNLATTEYTSDPGQQDPGAAPYCSECRKKMDKPDEPGEMEIRSGY